ncbi:helicase, RecD/TraA family [Desulfovibrio sp. X2]|uniref:SF1B family DNA helicase RecD2 n=1 Tax=Desulfovibrio sp. X2 TaxID=941449 RepID=UPI000358B46E|nr:ATP-dependent RecD-like DNA helicase [Desulfovibrio sp. X2]EPR37603.1 helicase, RecD/TraA family [Desulfovibrio sp. X2]
MDAKPLTLDGLPEEPDLTRIVGEVLAVTFHNPLSGWTVARLKVREESGQTTAIGCLGSLTPGEMLEMWGEWKEHPRFGRQFEVTRFVQAYPASLNGIIRYLGSGLIKGIGRTMAEKLTDRFGAEVLDILDREPERLLEVEGIGRKKLKGIVESWESQREIRNLMLFLQTHEVPTTYASRIFSLYGSGAIAKLEENPYELAYHIRGIGFRTADAMALRLGFAPDALERVEAAVIYALFSMSEKGHLFYPEENLHGLVHEMLGGVDRERFEEALAGLEERKRVRVEDLPEQNVRRAVWLTLFWKVESEVATRLYGLFSHPCPKSFRKKVEGLLPGLESEAGIDLSGEQREAVVGACVNKAYIVTGGPGTGKTTITRMIVRALAAAGLNTKLCAPTGRAAKRMSEAAGAEASTIHRLLQYQPDGGFGHNEESKLKAEAVIVDEASMLDVQLFQALLRALPLTCRLVLVGDVNQLPSVGPGNVLSDLLSSEAVPTSKLTHIYRQAMESYIVRNAHRVNSGQFPEEDPEAQPPKKDFWWIVQDDPAKVRQLILDSVCRRIPAAYGLDPLRDVQVLSPMHKGEVGTQALNQAVQEALNSGGPELVRGQTRFRAGDRIIQMRNNYEKDVFNGDLGFVDEVDPGSGELLADFDGRMVPYEAGDLDELTLAYAISVHKSQGSEYPAVVIPMVTQHYVLLQRNLLYTALTRAKRLVVMVGSRRAVGLALRNDKSDRRFTHLRYRLQELVNS